MKILSGNGWGSAELIGTDIAVESQKYWQVHFLLNLKFFINFEEKLLLSHVFLTPTIWCLIYTVFSKYLQEVKNRPTDQLEQNRDSRY